MTTYSTTIACEICAVPTEMLSTKRCDRCYEVEERLPGFLAYANGRAHVLQLFDIKPTTFDPTELDLAAIAVEKIRTAFIPPDGDTSGASIMAEPHFLIALSLLEQAAHNFKLAAYHQAQANAGRR